MKWSWSEPDCTWAQPATMATQLTLMGLSWRGKDTATTLTFELTTNFIGETQS